MQALDLSFFLALAYEENGIRAGYNRNTGIWKPHASPEGGNDTIAYGHKLKNDQEIARYNRGIDGFEAVNLFVEDYNNAFRQSKSDWDEHHRDTLWDDLPRKYQLILAEIVFNSGPMVRNGQWVWPKLALAIKRNDDQGVYEQSIRSYTKPDGTKHRLTKRTTAICRSLGMDFAIMD
jgi:hypothetical protein